MSRTLLSLGPIGAVLVAVAYWGAGCGIQETPGILVVSAAFGDPLPGLTAEELARFEAGHVVFSRIFEVADGLGPRFNENACNACHTDPADGGNGETSVTKATRIDPDDGRCDLLSLAGGENLRIRSTTVPRNENARVPVPIEATHVAQFTVPFLFGLGIVEAIPVERLRNLEDPDDRDGDGISGRLGADGTGKPARFGRKSDVATLADFVDGAFRLEMGLTTHLVSDEARAGDLPPVGAPGADPASEPEIDRATAEAVTDFLRFLAPPGRAELEPASEPLVRRGEALFTGLGCAGCHVPVLAAGPSPVAAIDGARIGLYSDLLLHDMGPALEGTCAPGATTREYRTEPLIGLRARRQFMHDGRYGRVVDAVLGHDGEARAARDRFASLDRLTQEALLRFLDTL
jgi:CxxC motif-containing protein (DUF1111 family)